jgi:O-antigen/teichoic acid export membrane protein
LINQRKAGVLLSYLSMGLNTVINFVYVPILLYFLTKEEFGLYQLIGSLIAYMSVMDFGLGNTITRYYSRGMASGSEKEKENILAISSIIYALITLVVLLIGGGLYFFLDSFFNQSLSVNELVTAKMMYLILLINIVVTIPGNLFTAVINSNERFIFSRLLKIVQTTLQPFVVVAIFMRWPSAINLTIIQTVFNVLVIFINGIYCFKVLRIKIKLHQFNTSLVKEMLGYSFFIFLGVVVDQIYWKTDQLILGIAAGTSAVAIYSIATQLDMAFMTFSGNISNVFMPKLSRILTNKEGMNEANRIFIKVGRIQFIVVSLILSGFILFGRQFISYWAGEDFADAYWMALVVMIPLSIPLIQTVGISILQAQNKHGFRSVAYAIIALFNVILSIILVKQFGGMGCAIATSVSLLLGHGITMNIYYHRNIGLDVVGLFFEIRKMLVASILALGVGALISVVLNINSLFMLIVEMGVFVGVFVVFMWLIGFNQYEKGLVRGFVSRISRRGIGAS